MEVLLINVCTDGPLKSYKKYMASPPQSIFSIAASTPKYVNIDMVDENINMVVNYRHSAELVVISFATADAHRAYQIADAFKNRNKTVILSGSHVKFNRREASHYADSLLVGETEGIWEQLLEDYKKGDLRKQYERLDDVDLRKVKPYPKSIITSSSYNHVWGVLVSRGCTKKCHDCLPSQFFESVRYRDISDIVEEIRDCHSNLIHLQGDNIMNDPAYLLELFDQLKKLNIKWFAEMHLSFLENDLLVKKAVESGLSYLVMKAKVPTNVSLFKLGQQKKTDQLLKDQIKYLHDNEVIVDMPIVFGLDDHASIIFEEASKYVRSLDIDSSQGIIQTPYPGTELYNQLVHEGRLRTKDWSKYDGRHLVFDHPHFDELDIVRSILKYEYDACSLDAVVRYGRFIMKMGMNAYR